LYAERSFRLINADCVHEGGVAGGGVAYASGLIV